MESPGNIAAAIRPASTLVLLRDAASGLEVFMQRRAEGAAFLAALRADAPDLLARVSDVALVPEGFAVTDRVARARLLFGPNAAEPARPGEPGKAAPLWRAFLALRPELDRHALPLAEADLRFSGRIVLTAPGDAGRGKT